MKKKLCDRRIRPTIDKACESCGVTFPAPLHQVKIGRGRFCSVRCKNKYNGRNFASMNQKGENNPNWKGGISKENIVYKKRFRAKYPEKAKAHDAVTRATKSGKLQRQNCCKCGAANAHGHHEDYSKRLEVTWLCGVCHRKRHGASC